MRVAGRRYRDEWLPNYYPARPVGDEVVRVSRTGRLIALTRDEDRQLEQIFMDDGLFGRLEHTGHIVTAANSSRVMGDLRKWFSMTYAGPSLHIIAATKRCNLNCTYCHMLPEAPNSDAGKYDLTPEVGEAIVRFILDSPSPRCLIEFQGGEPFLNFEGIRATVEAAKRLNREVGKDLDFAVVSNLMVAKDEQLQYCVDNRINVSYTLNGPPDVHDRYRLARNGKGSYWKTHQRIQEVRAKFPGLISAAPLCVIGTESAADVIRMIDFFHDAGFDSVALIKLRHLGNARKAPLGFEYRKFINAYLAGLEHILAKNARQDRVYSERMLRVVMAKILCESDVGYVDWRNPTGDVSCVLCYDYDGEILPSDEARSMREQFSLGNVRDTRYADLMASERTFQTMNLSLRDRDPVCRECAYNPYCGVAPILEYARTGSLVPRPHESEECLFVMDLLDWTIRHYLEDPLSLVSMLPGIEPWLDGLIGGAQKARSGGSNQNCAVA
jgi:uncharacterized protein